MRKHLSADVIELLQSVGLTCPSLFPYEFPLKLDLERNKMILPFKTFLRSAPSDYRTLVHNMLVMDPTTTIQEFSYDHSGKTKKNPIHLCCTTENKKQNLPPLPDSWMWVTNTTDNTKCNTRLAVKAFDLNFLRMFGIRNRIGSQMIEFGHTISALSPKGSWSGDDCDLTDGMQVSSAILDMFAYFCYENDDDCGEKKKNVQLCKTLLFEDEMHGGIIRLLVVVAVHLDTTSDQSKDVRHWLQECQDLGTVRGTGSGPSQPIKYNWWASDSAGAKFVFPGCLGNLQSVVIPARFVSVHSKLESRKFITKSLFRDGTQPFSNKQRGFVCTRFVDVLRPTSSISSTHHEKTARCVVKEEDQQQQQQQLLLPDTKLAKDVRFSVMSKWAKKQQLAEYVVYDTQVSRCRIFPFECRKVRANHNMDKLLALLNHLLTDSFFDAFFRSDFYAQIITILFRNARTLDETDDVQIVASFFVWLSQILFRWISMQDPKKRPSRAIRRDLRLFSDFAKRQFSVLDDDDDDDEEIYLSTTDAYKILKNELDGYTNWRGFFYNVLRSHNSDGDDKYPTRQIRQALFKIGFGDAQFPIFLRKDGGLDMPDLYSLANDSMAKAKKAKNTRTKIVVDSKRKQISFFQRGRNEKDRHLLTVSVLQILGSGVSGSVFLVKMGDYTMVMKIQDALVATDDVFFRWNEQHQAYFTAESCLESMGLFITEYVSDNYQNKNNMDANITTPKLLASLLVVQEEEQVLKEYKMVTFSESFTGFMPLGEWEDYSASRKYGRDNFVVNERIRRFEDALWRSPNRFSHSDLHTDNALVKPNNNPYTSKIVVIDYGRCSFLVRPKDMCFLSFSSETERKEHEQFWKDRCRNGGILFCSWWNVHRQVEYTNHGNPCSESYIRSSLRECKEEKTCFQ